MKNEISFYTYKLVILVIDVTRLPTFVKYIWYGDYNLLKVHIILKTNDIQIEKNEITTHIRVTFEDPEVQPEKSNFLKERLNKYKFYINSEYSLKSEIKYNETSKLLSIYVNIIIPDHHVPYELDKANAILMEPINTFQLFYDAQTEIYNRKYKKI